jgi:hypothetical protein
MPSACSGISNVYRFDEKNTDDKVSPNTNEQGPEFQKAEPVEIGAKAQRSPSGLQKSRATKDRLLDGHGKYCARQEKVIEWT